MCVAAFSWPFENKIACNLTSLLSSEQALTVPSVFISDLPLLQHRIFTSIDWDLY